MAQRRVNLKAVGIILVVMVGLMGSLIAAKLFLFKKDPKRYVMLAERNLRDNDLQAAALNYATAISADPNKNLEVRVAYGDVLHKLSRIDDSYAGQDRMMWDSVLERDPTNREALGRMLRAMIEIVEFNPEPAAISRLQDLAERILKLPPDGGKDDKEQLRSAALRADADAYQHIAVIAGWLADIVKSESEIRDNTDALEKLLAENVDRVTRDGQKAAPINPDIPYYLGTAYVRQARELRTQNRPKDAEKLERRAYAMFDAVVTLQPNNAVLSLRFSQLLRSISDVLDDDSKDDRQDYVQRMRTVLENARTSVALTDPAFSEVYIFYAQFLLRNKDPDGAEELLRELCKRKPDDQSARLALGQLLHNDPAKRDEIIALLKKSITDSGDQFAVTYRSKIALERQTLADLTNYLVEAYGSNSDPDKRVALMKDVEENYQKLVDRVGIVPSTLKLKGRISLMKGGPNGAIDAIPDLEKAKELLALHNPSRAITDWELEFFLAIAYMDSNQTGAARQHLWDIVNGLPNFIPARIMLTRLLISDHDMEAAREQVTEIKKRSPEDPQISKLETAIYLQEPKKVTPEEMERVLNTMPEGTRAEIISKVQVYVYANRLKETVRLYELLRSKDPADLEAVRSLAQIYMADNKKDLAVKVADEAIAKSPDNISLKIVRAQIDKDSAKVLALTEQALSAIKNPVEREMSFYEFYNAQDKKPLALQHLDLAEKAEPENIKIMDLRFGLALLNNQWDVAEKYANRLAVKNADEANGLIYRYRLALVQGKLKVAEGFARELVKSKPQFARSYLCYGDVLKDEHQYEEAAGKYQAALEKQPENIEAYRGLVECYYSLKRPDDAFRYIRAGLKVVPNNPWLKEQEIAYYLSFGDPTKALESRKAAADENPESLGAQLAYGAAQWQVGQHFAQKGNKVEEAKSYAAQARETFDKIVAKWPDDRLPYAYLADIATYNADFAAGEAALKTLAGREKWKTLPDPYVLLADYYFRFGKMDQAEAAYAQAVSKLTNKTDSAAIEIQQKQAAFLTTQKKFDQALEVLKPLATSRKVRQQIVETLLSNNKLTEAGNLLDQYLAEAPTDAQFLATRGFLLLQEKKVSEALAIMDKAVALEPNNQTALYYRGMIKLRQGPAAIEDAIKDLTAARDITNEPGAQVSVSSQVQARVALAEALRSHNQIDEAVGEMQMCLDLQPGNKELRVRLIEMLGTLVTPRWTEVEKLINDAVKMKEFEKDPDWRRLSSTMWLQRNQPDKALASIRSALELAKGQPERTLPLMEDYLNVLSRLKKYQELLNECDELLKNRAFSQNAWWVYHMRAIAQANSDGKRADAINDFDKALEITARLRNDDATVMIIQSIADTIGLEPAIARCQREAGKGDNHWRVILTYLYFSKKDFKAAQETIEQVLADSQKLTPREREVALGVAGSVYMLSAEYKKAEDVYQKLLAINDKDTVSLNNLACIWAEYLEPPDTAKALKYSQAAMDVVREKSLPDPNIMDTHGWVLTLDGKVDEGITYIQAALDKRPMMEAKYHMGMALLKKGLAPEALQQLDRARKMLDDRKNKGLTTDPTMEARLNEGLFKARQIVNGIGAGAATAPVSSGTDTGVKP